MTKEQELKNALESMVWQFGYTGVGKSGNPIIYTGGLSALEEAFDALGWEDPHIIDRPELECDVKDCRYMYVGSQHIDIKGKIHLICLCSDCFTDYREGRLLKFKETALKRERLRDEDGVLPNEWEKLVYKPKKLK